MAEAQTISSTAHAYARSLLDLATEQGQAQSMGEELAGVARIIRENPPLRDYLADPGINHFDQWAAMQRIFGGRISPLLMNFLGVVLNNGRIRELGEMDVSYGNLYDEQTGTVEVDITSSHRLDSEELNRVQDRIGQALGKNAVLHHYVDEKILGGLVVRVQDRLIDASVRYQLEAVRQRLLAARPR